MKLRECRICERRLASSEKMCPYCHNGDPFGRRRCIVNLLTVLVWMMIIVLVIWLGFTRM